jgi:hypothetical protein
MISGRSSSVGGDGVNDGKIRERCRARTFPHRAVARPALLTNPTGCRPSIDPKAIIRTVAATL